MQQHLPPVSSPLTRCDYCSTDYKSEDGLSAHLAKRPLHLTPAMADAIASAALPSAADSSEPRTPPPTVDTVRVMNTSPVRVPRKKAMKRVASSSLPEEARSPVLVNVAGRRAAPVASASKVPSSAQCWYCLTTYESEEVMRAHQAKRGHEPPSRRLSGGRPAKRLAVA
uniref:Uncharacterized protein n=1 Tax=Sexangularia sp. CB-2014 TaxID=1486929 RepID=A0A7S1YCD6_9EUKA|mmetsp:Transcript_13589/g.42772  ORF Transcript_13589/g.42772 Transcript_13589/m.42772 type:complete len:169 (+) Transcript_13589:1-507(+)